MRASWAVAVFLALAASRIQAENQGGEGRNSDSDGGDEWNDQGAPVGRRSPREWSKVLGSKLDDVEKQWEEGDDPELLVTEDQLLMKEWERRKKQQPKFDPRDPKAFTASMMGNSNSMQTMVFATLTEKDADGKKRTKESTDILAAQWKELLFTGGVDATCYNIEPTIILCTLMKGWKGRELKDFMVQQPGVVEVEWNQMKFKPEKAESGKRSKKGRKGGKGKGRKGKSGKAAKGSKSSKAGKHDKRRKEKKGKQRRERPVHDEL